MRNAAFSRRSFIGSSVIAATALGASGGPAAGKPALLGGTPVRTASWPPWPKIANNDRKSWAEVLERGRWGRRNDGYAERFERIWAEKLGARYCLAAANGTTSLYTALRALDVGPGDEVIVPVYTFVATINAVLLQHALPVIVDTDPETFQIDAKKIEAAITPRTRVIMPVHIGGSAADLDTIQAVARKHNLPVLEDACQAHLAEWRHKKLSTIGDLGCFSFQASKNLNSGEGGCVVTSSEKHIEFCRSFHNNGRGKANASFSYVRNGCNFRMTEFQAALLIEQLTRVEEQSHVREQNAAYLAARLEEIPGIKPARMYSGCTRNAYHLFMFRYGRDSFANLPRTTFLKALAAEGIPCSGGYAPLDKEPFLNDTLESRGFQMIYGAHALREYRDRIHCPVNDRLCEEAVWMTQTMLLGSRTDMDQIADAIRKIQAHAAELGKGDRRGITSARARG